MYADFSSRISIVWLDRAGLGQNTQAYTHISPMDNRTCTTAGGLLQPTSNFEKIGFYIISDAIEWDVVESGHHHSLKPGCRLIHRMGCEGADAKGWPCDGLEKITGYHKKWRHLLYL